MNCLDCPSRNLYSRGLCHPCWRQRRDAGTLPPMRRPAYHDSAEIAEEYEWFRSWHMSDERIAERIGVSVQAMHRALLRHQSRQAVA